MIYLELYYVFFIIGIVTFGGGYAMIPLIQQEAISREWITNELLFNFLAVSESTPGSFAINIATFIGNMQGGILGGICATLGVITPSFFIILIIYQFYKRFIKNQYVNGVMYGLMAVVVGIIFSVALNLIIDEISIDQNLLSLNYPAIILFALLLLIKYSYQLIFKKSLNPIMLILISAILGVITYGFIL